MTAGTIAIVARNTDGSIRQVLEGGFSSATEAAIASIERYPGVPRITFDPEPVATTGTAGETR